MNSDRFEFKDRALVRVFEDSVSKSKEAQSGTFPKTAKARTKIDYFILLIFNLHRIWPGRANAVETV